jgi:cytochrome c-type biogenesis protein CcmH/NrfF
MTRPARASILVFAVAVACSSPSATTLTERAHQIEGQVWSPYCPGRLLIDCTTPQARELRASIAARFEKGDSSGEVLAWIERNHGPEALARPEGRGLGLVLWAGLAAVFVAGAILVVRVVRKATRPSASPPNDRRVPGGVADPDAIARLRMQVERDL